MATAPPVAVAAMALVAVAARFPAAFRFAFFAFFFNFDFVAFAFFGFAFGGFSFFAFREARKPRLRKGERRGEGGLRADPDQQAEGDREKRCDAAVRGHPPKDRPFWRAA